RQLPLPAGGCCCLWTAPPTGGRRGPGRGWPSCPLQGALAAVGCPCTGPKGGRRIGGGGQNCSLSTMSLPSYL
ncbi:hypothetical protein BHE74_00056530, partial [Ensete ventricosum]